MAGMRARIVTFSVKQDVTTLVEKHAKWAWILHDKDVNEDTGEVKEPHYHYYIEFPNSRYIASVAKEFDIPENMIEVVRNKTGVLRYLTHSTEDSKSKYQYDISEVHASFEIEQATQGYDMQSIYDMISQSGSVREAISRVYKAGYTGNALIGVSYIISIYDSINREEKSQ